VIPLRDENPTRRRAVVTIALLVLNIGVYLLLQPHGRTKAVVELPAQKAGFELKGSSPEPVFLYGRAAIPCEILHRRSLTFAEIARTVGSESTVSDNENSCGKATNAPKDSQKPLYPRKAIWLAILTSMFLHGGLMHLAGNMLFLWIFGNNVEDRWGRVPFIVFYVVGGVVATLGHALIAPNSTIPLVGASGAIAAVMGAYLVLFPKVKIRALFAIFPIRISAWILLAIWFVSQFRIAPTEGVAWGAHVVGFIFGIVVALLLRKRNAPMAPDSVLKIRV
jgi:membrane associated rhomboid family serine protease